MQVRESSKIVLFEITLYMILNSGAVTFAVVFVFFVSRWLPYHVRCYLIKDQIIPDSHVDIPVKIPT